MFDTHPKLILVTRREIKEELPTHVQLADTIIDVLGEIRPPALIKLGKALILAEKVRKDYES